MRRGFPHILPSAQFSWFSWCSCVHLGLPPADGSRLIDRALSVPAHIRSLLAPGVMSFSPRAFFRWLVDSVLTHPHYSYMFYAHISYFIHVKRIGVYVWGGIRAAGEYIDYILVPRRFVLVLFTVFCALFSYTPERHAARTISPRHEFTRRIYFTVYSNYELLSCHEYSIGVLEQLLQK